MRLRRLSTPSGAARGVAIAPRALASAARRSGLRAPHSARARHVVSDRVRAHSRDITALHVYGVEQAPKQDEPIFPPIGDDLAEAAAVAYADSNPGEVVEALGVAAERLARLADDAGVDVDSRSHRWRIPKRRASPARARPPRLATPPDRRRAGPCESAGRLIPQTRPELRNTTNHLPVNTDPEAPNTARRHNLDAHRSALRHCRGSAAVPKLLTLDAALREGAPTALAARPRSRLRRFAGDGLSRFGRLIGELCRRALVESGVHAVTEQVRFRVGGCGRQGGAPAGRAGCADRVRSRAVAWLPAGRSRYVVSPSTSTDSITEASAPSGRGSGRRRPRGRLPRRRRPQPRRRGGPAA